MAMGQRVRERRLQLNMTLEQLSLRSEVDVGTISAIELRDSKRSEFVAQLAAALEVSADFLLTGTDSGFQPNADAELPVLSQAAPLPRLSRSPRQDAPRAQEPAPRFSDWPFPDVSPDAYRTLSDQQQAEVQGFVKALLTLTRLPRN